MLTQGWRRYDVPALLRGEYAEPEYALEAGQQISGRIVRAGLVNTRKRLGKYRMAMIVPRYGYLAEAPVRADGCFDLDGFDFPDSTAFVLRPQTTTGRMRNAFVKVDPETFPRTGFRRPIRPPEPAMRRRCSARRWPTSDTWARPTCGTCS